MKNPDRAAIARKMGRRYSIDGYTEEDIRNESWAAMLESNNPDEWFALAKDRIRSLRRSSLRRGGFEAYDNPVDEDGIVDAFLENTAIDPEPSVVDQAADTELRDKLRKVLTDKEFRIIECQFWYSMSDIEIADLLSIKPRTVQRYRISAYEKIREIGINNFDVSGPIE